MAYRFMLVLAGTHLGFWIGVWFVLRTKWGVFEPERLARLQQVAELNLDLCGCGLTDGKPCGACERLYMAIKEQ